MVRRVEIEKIFKRGWKLLPTHFNFGEFALDAMLIV